MQFRSRAFAISPFRLHFSLPAIFLLLLSVPVFGSDASLRAESARNIANDDTSAEDLAIRKAAVQALGTAAGTVVVMNARTGRIYTIVNQEWAIRHGFKPCSTIKLVTGVAGIREKLIAPNGNLIKQSYRLDLDKALAYSNNAYFQKVGANLGSEKMIAYAKELGLGEPTGLNAEDEFEGKLPYGNENLRIYSHADDFEVTPLQLAVMVSAITNGGKVVVPQIPRTKVQKTSFRGYMRREISLEPSIYERVIPGMMGAVGYGTARVIEDGLPVGGKTGSCISKGTWVGLFASVAPLNDPRFSVVVITRGSRARGKYSAAIAGKVYEALKPRFGHRTDNTLLAKWDGGNKKQNVRVVGEPREKPSAGGEGREDARTRDSVSKERASASSAAPGTNQKKQESKKPEPKSAEEMFPTIVIVKGKPEITRPRVIRN